MGSSARAIPVETVQVGDVVTLVWRDGDVERSAHGRIQNVVFHGHTRILHAESGAEIGRYTMAFPHRTQCVLHKGYTAVDTPLEGFDAL